MSDLVTINVSGTKFQVDESTFAKLEDTLSRLKLLGEERNSDFFIGRNATCFDSILYYHQTGELHLPPSVCPGIFRSELEFWNVDVRELEMCCNYKYASFLSEQDDLLKFEKHTKSWSKNYLETEKREVTRKWSALKLWMRRTMFDPCSSTCGKVYLGVFTAVVVTSIILMCVNTMDVTYRELEEEEWMEYVDEPIPPKYAIDVNRTLFVEKFKTVHPDLVMGVKKCYMLIIEYIVIGLFTLDLLLRALICTNVKAFCFDFLNIIDFIAVLCSYMKIIIKESNRQQNLQHSGVDKMDILNIIRLMRLIRVLCFHRDFRVLVYSLKISLKHLCLLLILLCTCIIFFSSAVFFFEDRETIPNIPFAFWWAIVTMTTVGYGDVVPKTILGKIVGAFCSLTGVMVLAVTLPVFVNNFTVFSNFAKPSFSSPKEGNKFPNAKENTNKIRDFPENKRLDQHFYKEKT